MSIRRRILVGVGVVAWLAVGGAPAWSTMDNVKSFKLAYPGKDAKAYSCKVCHLGAMGTKANLNPYGLALQKSKTTESKAPPAADAKKLTEKDYRAIEKDDADGDGASNLDEINAGTAPGDPASVPPKAAQK